MQIRRESRISGHPVKCVQFTVREHTQQINDGLGGHARRVPEEYHGRRCRGRCVKGAPATRIRRAAHAQADRRPWTDGAHTRGHPQNSMNPGTEATLDLTTPTFAELGARPETVRALAAAGITNAFAIQEYALPIGLRGADLIGQAPTGTGKTIGFGVPLLDRLQSPAEGASGLPQALVVVPTRELGLQVARDIAAAGKTRGIRVLALYGGVAYEPQVEALRRGVEIIVGTPGRLLDMAKPAKGKAQPNLRLD